MIERKDYTPICDTRDMLTAGYSGGLYPDGHNVPTGLYEQYRLNACTAVQPRDPYGIPDLEGHIGFLCIGMSNAGLYFRGFTDALGVHGSIHKAIRFVHAAKEGRDIRHIVHDNDEYWTHVKEAIRNAGLTFAQIQVVWLMQTVHGAALLHDPGEMYISWLADRYLDVVTLLRDRFPHLQLLYSSGREYGGYNPPGQGNPEPYAWYTGIAWKELIRRHQSTSAHPGPWIGWAGYFWANGVNARRDGLVWRRSDFQDDGVHPSPTGNAKAGRIMLDHFLRGEGKGWLFSG